MIDPGLQDETRSLDEELPVPTRKRFQVLRSGLLNLYKYDCEEFRFEQGCLLLRGNNGTGKSRVLALQLPFLLDGETASHRVEPDCDPAKRMEWNLLMDSHTDRLGYTWIEFGRQSDEGDPVTVTLGCGMRAVKGKGIQSRWFFITPQRIGRDFFLQTEHNQPLSREKLEMALEGRGEVYRHAQEYRAAVDQALFQLNDRYGSLVDLLIQLRQPQLSRKLDEERLSSALSEALPPLPNHLIEEVAESFRSLETDRNELDNLAAAQRGVEAFLKEYGRYVQIAARRRAEQVRKTHSSYESIMRRQREAEREALSAQTALGQIATELDTLRVSIRGARTEEQTLRDSPQMKDAQSLEEARLRARERKEALAKQNELHDRAALNLESARRHLQQQEALLEQAGQDVQQCNANALAAAGGCGLETAHREALASPEPFRQPAARQAASQSLNSTCDKRRHSIELLDRRNEELAAAQAGLARAEQGFQTAEDQLGRLRESERQARERLLHETEAVLRHYASWASSVTVLQPLESDAFAAAYQDWLELRQERNPLQAAVDQARRAAEELLHQERSRITAGLKQAQARRAELAGEQAELEQGRHAAPPPPHTRDPASRLDRPGAPLWMVCDFSPALEPAQRAGLEAALEASGLLDAWITPSGHLLAADTHDQIVVPDFIPSHPLIKSLADCLIPSIDPADPQASLLDAATVTRLLARIGLGEEAGSHRVGLDGRWQLGPLRGAWTKAEAEHIGHAAREALRQRRLRALTLEIAGVDATLREFESRLAELNARQQGIQQEHQSAPTDSQVLEARSNLDFVGRQAVAAQLRLEESEASLARARTAHGIALQHRDTDANDLGIAPWKDRLRELERQLGEYRTALAGLWPTVDRLLQARQHQADAGAARLHQETAHAAASEALQQARGELEAAETRHQTLQSSVGVAVEQILLQLERATGKIEQLESDFAATTARQQATAIREGVARKEIEAATPQLALAAADREAAIGQLHLFADHRLLQDAHPSLNEIEPGEWSVSRAVDLARQVEALLKEVPTDDDAWRRNQRDIYQHITTLQETLLPHGQQPQAIQIEDGIFVVTCGFQGKTCTMPELQRALTGEVLHRQQLLDAREREVLENHLIGEVATELQQLIRQGENLVREMNDELQSRPMSTGMALRFAWQLDPAGPSGMETARRQLMSTAGTWSPAEREALGGFLQERIRTVRTANETGTWREHLTEALDYRGWHRFHVERRQDNQWKRLTRRTYGTGSGGEKAIALTIPQFAAAAAHYRTASPHAPRLILLDEVFVGIDSDMRAKCMGLLEAFDLDFMMTSEREWGCYATVPGLAIYQLSSRPGIEAVGLTRWVWNGESRTRDTRPSSSGRPSKTRQAHPQTDSRELLNLTDEPSGES